MLNIKSVTDYYRKGFLNGIDPAQAGSDIYFNRHESYRHLRWMLDKIDAYVDEGRSARAMRWLGFVQGALWARGVFKIDEMVKHNMSDD